MKEITALLSSSCVKSHPHIAEQIFFDEQYAGRPVAVLEPDPRQHAGGGCARRRGFADHAHFGQQYGMAAEKPEAGRRIAAGTRTGDNDQFCPVISSKCHCH